MLTGSSATRRVALPVWATVFTNSGQQGQILALSALPTSKYHLLTLNSHTYTAAVAVYFPEQKG